MGLFNVVAPCVVNGLHYVRPTVQPIEVDDAVAGPLVGAGKLQPYPLPAVEQPVKAAEPDEVPQPASPPSPPLSLPGPPKRRPRKPRSTDA